MGPVDSWVERIDIAQLLGTRDLPDERARLVSLLDSTVLGEIANDALDLRPRASKRAYLAEDFEVLLTVTNLRGVPYEIPLIASAARGHAMSMHAELPP